jgi:hypothetical protein
MKASYNTLGSSDKVDNHEAEPAETTSKARTNEVS